MFRRSLAAVAAVVLLVFSAVAQGDYVAQTAGNPAVEVEVLKLRLKPLQKDQVQAEADAWLALLAVKNGEISAQQIAMRTAEGDARTALSTQLAENTAAQTRLVDRLNLALVALAERGGEIEAYQKYVSASTTFQIQTDDLKGTLDFVTNWVVSPEGGIRLGLNVVKFLLMLIAFKVLAAILAGIVEKALSRMRRTSELLRDFFVNTVRKLTFFIGLVVALSQLGIDIGPFIAAIGAAGFVIGFALQGTLSNFAAGIMILVYRPYDIGQVVTVAGTTGKVDEMSLVSTTLRLADNQTVVVPNNSIWGGVITNITGQATRRVDMKFGCGYGDDLKKVQRVLEEVVKAHPKVLAEPETVIKLGELGDSSVNFLVRPWVRSEDYWDVLWDITRAVKERFDAEGLSIPFPQRDVHLHQIAPTSA
ncbi:MAG: mechanosensitive ion channel family protein [Planctomycetes bacterium]|nr:mechanosensitive ion channel family protein [Planctomycetota bacterium]MCB9886481.1 mechanosensitive ion channel family protein [Planctomycetota bacterium]